MKILSIAAAVALSTMSLSALAKDVDQVGVADNVFTFTTAGSQSVVIGTAIEGGYSSQTAVALGVDRSITGTNRSITGTNRSITGTNRSITGTNRSITGTNRSITGTNRWISGTGRR